MQTQHDTQAEIDYAFITARTTSYYLNVNKSKTANFAENPEAKT